MTVIRLSKDKIGFTKHPPITELEYAKTMTPVVENTIAE